MKKLSIIIPLMFTLTGCPGGSREGLELGERQSIYIDNPHICFSVNKNDVLNRYTLEQYGKINKQLLAGDGVKLSYPATCFNIELKSGVSYTLNSKNYRDNFIIDNDGIIHYPGN